MILHHRGFPIRISPDRSLFAAPRGFSQLVTSFFGSWCQGIHLMLLLAWTSILYMVLVLFIAWVSQYYRYLVLTRLRKDFCLSTLCAIIVIIITTTFGKTNKFYIIASLISVRFLYSVVNDLFVLFLEQLWLAQVDSNHRPRAYQARALTSWAMRQHWFCVVLHLSYLVEMMGFEPMTPCLQGRCSPSWATPPYAFAFGLWGKRSSKIEQQESMTRAPNSRQIG